MLDASAAVQTHSPKTSCHMHVLPMYRHVHPKLNCKPFLHVYISSIFACVEHVYVHTMYV